MKDFDYEKFEQRCEARRQENARYLALFEESLERAGLTRRMIDWHLDNIGFYLNVFLIRSEPLGMERGCFNAGEFLGDFFIYKCMRSTPSSIRSNAASFKKFYKCMLERGVVEKESYDYLVETIR